MARHLTYEEASRELEKARRRHYRAANPSEATMRRETTPDAMLRRQRRVRKAQAAVEFWAIRVKNLRPD